MNNKEIRKMIKVKLINESEENEKRLVECPRCNGDGELHHFKHIQAGKCFECNGRGKVFNWESPKIVARMKAGKAKWKAKKDAKKQAEMERKKKLWKARETYAINFNIQVIEKVILPSIDTNYLNKFHDWKTTLGMANHLKITTAKEFLDVIKDYAKRFTDPTFEWYVTKYLLETYDYKKYMEDVDKNKDFFRFYDMSGFINKKTRETIRQLQDKYQNNWENAGQ